MPNPEPPTTKTQVFTLIKLSPKTRRLIGHVTAVLLAVGITVGIVLSREQIQRFSVYGYPAVFLISLIGNATIILPTPSMAVVFGVGGALNPVAVGIVAGLGSALGELTGYLAGVGGRAIIKNRDLYNRLEKWMRKRGVLVIFVLAVIPNPAFDVGGMVAGALGMPVWHFLLAAWAGKSVRLIILALGGQLIFTELLTIPLLSSIL
jgi:membrane protein YqaA with SNARE-associated domain